MQNEIIKNKTYDEKIEIFFVGKLFSYFVDEYIDSFDVQHIIDKMM